MLSDSKILKFESGLDSLAVAFKLRMREQPLHLFVFFCLIFSFSWAFSWFLYFYFSFSFFFFFTFFFFYFLFCLPLNLDTKRIRIDFSLLSQLRQRAWQRRDLRCSWKRKKEKRADFSKWIRIFFPIQSWGMLGRIKQKTKKKKEGGAVSKLRSLPQSRAWRLVVKIL